MQQSATQARIEERRRHRAPRRAGAARRRHETDTLPGASARVPPRVRSGGASGAPARRGAISSSATPCNARRLSARPARRSGGTSSRSIARRADSDRDCGRRLELRETRRRDPRRTGRLCVRRCARSGSASGVPPGNWNRRCHSIGTKGFGSAGGGHASSFMPLIQSSSKDRPPASITSSTCTGASGCSVRKGSRPSRPASWLSASRASIGPCTSSVLAKLTSAS